MSDQPKDLTQVGYYCWACEGLQLRACRSDCVPVYVPAEWVPDVEADIQRLEDERAA